MYGYALVLLLISILPLSSGFFYSNLNKTGARYEADFNIRKSVLFDNFIYYRQAVIGYVEKNPGYTGSIPDNLLVFQSGFNVIGPWANFVSANQIYIYSSTPNRGLLEAVPNSPWLGIYLIGYKINGFLVTPTDTNQPLPLYIPEDSLVSLINKN